MISVISISLERSHAEIEKKLDQYKPRVIQMTETVDALKQENWDLNVSKQNLEEQLGEIKSALKKAELDTHDSTRKSSRRAKPSIAASADRRSCRRDRPPQQDARDRNCCGTKERAACRGDVSTFRVSCKRFVNNSSTIVVVFHAVFHTASCPISTTMMPAEMQMPFPPVCVLPLEKPLALQETRSTLRRCCPLTFGQPSWT